MPVVMILVHVCVAVAWLPCRPRAAWAAAAASAAQLIKVAWARYLEGLAPLKHFPSRSYPPQAFASLPYGFVVDGSHLLEYESVLDY